MRTRSFLGAVALASTLVLAGCGDDGGQSAAKVAPAAAREPDGSGERKAAAMPGDRPSSSSRWYAAEHVERGAALYGDHCAACHGNLGQGTFAWRKKGTDGKFPPPPLDGTAHTWHHPLRALVTQIKFGAPGGQGSMPGFAESLSEEQVLDVIAWIQARWPDEIYAQWLDIQRRSRASN